MDDIDFSVGDMPTSDSGNNKVLAQVDRYELLSELGRGGFGAVFLAKDTVSEQWVALKTLPPELSHSAEDMESVKENFALVSKLKHPNIASNDYLHKIEVINAMNQGVHLQRGDYLLIMEYVEGSTLSSWRKQFDDRRVPFDKALDICAQLASALDFAHQNNVLHRDIKPGNIMIATNGQAKVLDFGLAAEIRSSMSRLSNDGNKFGTSGTLPYMSPEQLQGDRQDARSDQYALAVLLYELLEGEVPFKDLFETNDRILINQVIPTKAVGPIESLSKSQNANLVKALAKVKEDRFETCVKFIENMSSNINAFRAPEANSSGSKAPIILGACALLAVGAFFAFEKEPAVEKDEVTKLRVTDDATEVNVPVLSPSNETRANQLEILELERARAAREQATKEAKVKFLLVRAQQLFDAARYSELNIILSEVLKLDEYNVQAAALREKNADKIGQDSVQGPKSRALILERKIRKVSEKQNFSNAINELKAILMEAGFKLELKNYSGAVDLYNKYIVKAKALQLADDQRHVYLDQKQQFDALKAGIDFNDFRRADLQRYKKFMDREREAGVLAKPNSFNEATHLLKSLSGEVQQLKKFIEQFVLQEKIARLETQLNLSNNDVERNRLIGDLVRLDRHNALAQKIKAQLKTVLNLEIKPSGAELYIDGQINTKRSLQLQYGKTYQMKLIREGFCDLEFSYKADFYGARDLTKSLKEIIYWTNQKIAFGDIAFQPIQKGSFMMGSADGDSDERPMRQVTLSQDFWMAKTEVTQRQWVDIMGVNPSDLKGDSLPVENVSWLECQKFIQKLNKRLVNDLPVDYKFALPTEAQWEYACRANTNGPYAGNLDAMAWYQITSKMKPQEVGKKQGNAFGLHDMHGNVREWCLDVYGAYSADAIQDPTGPSEGSSRILRGGGWGYAESKCTSSYRDKLTEGSGAKGLGLRLVLVKQ